MTYNKLKRKSNQLHINDIVLDWKRILNAKNFTLAIDRHLNHESLMLEIINSIEILEQLETYYHLRQANMCDARAVI